MMSTQIPPFVGNRLGGISVQRAERGRREIGRVHRGKKMVLRNKQMAQTIDEFIASGDFQIGAVDPKSRIAPITQN